MRKHAKVKGSNKGTPKENNRHAYGRGHGKFGKKADRIERMKARGEKK